MDSENDAFSRQFATYFLHEPLDMPDSIPRADNQYDSKENYYKLWWQLYLKNELLLKEYADILNQKEDVKRKIIQIKVRSQSEILRRCYIRPRCHPQGQEKTPEKMQQGNGKTIHLPIC